MDQYTILSTIARTATSQVLMVSHKTSGQQFAIKQLIIPERLEEELYSSMQGDLIVVPNEYYDDESDSDDESLSEKPNEIHLPISIQTENTNIQIPTSFVTVVDHGEKKKVSNNNTTINIATAVGGLHSSTMLNSSKVNSGSFKKKQQASTSSPEPTIFQKIPTPTLSPRIDSSVNKGMFNLSIQGVSPSSPVSKTHKQPTILMVESSSSDESDDETSKNTSTYNNVKSSLQAEIKAKQEMKYIQNEIQALKILEKGPSSSKFVNTDVIRVSVEDKISEFKKHICLMKEVIEEPEEGKLCLVLEYANGGDVFSIIEHYDETTPLGHMKEEQARFYFKQIVHGVLYMHRCGVCHRDLKPENILVVETPNSTPLLKISDFGFCGILKNKDKTFTDLVGTESWCAPEILNREPYDGLKSDVWSLGCILYALLTGCFAFDHDDPHELLKLIQQVQIQFPPYISKDTKDFISAMICHSPTKRLSIEQVLEHAWMKKPSYL
ncbi:predicted protein [Naegleria gruberi]|uniref:Predicted protein n=1 Tax=Naegleria gruberi TaxID=5762 RepID=D2VLT2_NAEGR|nr:uncharacterized protein NAEGRDRAFT_50619 [Naegleria gruberi]EFC42108.1 predicted protein [Naegleria gruberi]|eukprot:XP_002674852.1 predicted protein [Naegleria gruberi strain NEG-M]